MHTLTALTTLTTRSLDLVLPARCVGCRGAGGYWCAGCLRRSRDPCPVRRPGTLGALPGYAFARYTGSARQVVLSYKERGTRPLAGPIGAALAELVPLLAPDGPVCLVPVPSRRVAARARGGPHMLAATRRCADVLAGQGRGVVVAPALRMDPGVRDSAGLGPAQRAANLAGRIVPHAHGMPAPGTPVLLLDDVLTTGTTVAHCARALAAAGLAVRGAIVFTDAERR